MITFARFRDKSVSVIRHLILLILFSPLIGCNSLSGYLFYPDKNYYRTPDQIGVAYEPIILEKANGNTLQNWLIKPEGEINEVVLFLHGNGENISTHIGSVAWLTEFGVAVFLLDYQGYGASTGHPTLASAFSDIAAAHRWISQHYAEHPLILFGQSMGGALAIYYAANQEPDLKKIDALATESAPASWPQIAREVMARHWLTWLLQGPASLITGSYDADEAIQSLPDIPLLMMHSTEDPVVPFHHYQQLLELAPANTQKIETTGRHISALRLKENREKLLDFIRSTDR